MTTKDTKNHEDPWPYLFSDPEPRYEEMREAAREMGRKLAAQYNARFLDALSRSVDQTSDEKKPAQE